MRASSPIQTIRIVSLALAALFYDAHGAAPVATLTRAEQEVLESLFQQDTVRNSKRLVVREVASIKEIRFTNNHEQFAAKLRKEAQDRDPALKEAVEDFLKKNQSDTKLVLPTNALKKVELVSDSVIEEIFSNRPNGTTNGWTLFYQRFPDSGGLITLSRVGMDSKGKVAIVYLGRHELPLSGEGHIRILKREGNKWVLYYEPIGPGWVS